VDSAVPTCRFSGTVDGSTFHKKKTALAFEDYIMCNSGVDSSIPVTLSCTIISEEFGETIGKNVFW
jgi:hypothetical protein